MPALRLHIFLHILQLAMFVHCQLSDLRRCADPLCQKLISEARTTVKYPSGYAGVLSFPNNAVAKIYSKDAGTNTDWWGVEINGKHGYAPKKFLREDRVLVPDKLLQHVVPVDASSSPANSRTNAPSDDKLVNKVVEGRVIENVAAEADVEADGGEEFDDAFDDDVDEMEGIQIYSKATDSHHKDAPVEDAHVQTLESEVKHSKNVDSRSSTGDKDASTNHLSPSTVNFEVVDGTTIVNDLVDTTQPPPLDYLPDYETPPPVHPTTTNTAYATSAPPSFAQSSHTPAPLSSVGVDGTATPELQIVPSGFPLSSLNTREAPVTASPLSVQAEDTHTSAAQADSIVLTSENQTSGEPEESKISVLPDSSSSVVGVDNGSSGAKKVIKNKGRSAKNNLELESNDVGLNSVAPPSDAKDHHAGEEFNPSPARLDDASVREVVIDEIFGQVKSEDMLGSSDVKLNPDHVIEEMLHDNNESIVESDVNNDKEVSEDSADGSGIAPELNESSKDAEETTPSTLGSNADVENEGEGSIFDGWLNGWSNSEEIEAANEELPAEPLQSQVNFQAVDEQSSPVSDDTYSNKVTGDETQSSVNEVSFITTAHQVAEREQRSSFGMTTTPQLVAATTTEATAVGDASDIIESPERMEQDVDDDGKDVPSDNEAPSDASEVPQSADGVESVLPTTEPANGESEATDIIDSSVDSTADPAATGIIDSSGDSTADPAATGIIDSSGDSIADPVESPTDESLLGIFNTEPILDALGVPDEPPPEHGVCDASTQPSANVLSESVTDILDKLSSDPEDVAPTATPAEPPAVPDSPTDSSTIDPSSESSDDLHDPESLTGHLLKTVEPIILLLTGSSQLGESLSLALEHDLSTPVTASGSLVAVVVLALTILLLYAINALITKCSREGPLLKALNVLEHEQHTSEAIIADMHRQLAASQTASAAGAEGSAEAARLLAELQNTQEENEALTERVQELEQQLEESTSSGLEMDNMLQDLLHSQKDTASFQEAIDSLQLMLDSQREKVESLTADLTIKTTLNEELRGESVSSKERISKLEYQLDQVTRSLEEVNSAKAQVAAQLATEQTRLQEVSEQHKVLSKGHNELSGTVASLTEKHTSAHGKTLQLQKALKTREAELQVTKECLKQLKVFNDGKAAKDKLSQLLDVVKARSELTCAVKEKASVESELQQQCDQVQELEQRVQQVQQEAEQCKRDQNVAEQDKREALSKLAVLTDYFHEKEAQLTKELESESGLRLDAEGSAETITSRIRNYDMQLMAYKTQVDTLKKELEDQELSFKTQLATQEQKAHESWVSARAAERKYEESKQETAQMRSRLLLMSKDNNEQQHHAIVKPTPQHVETSNGSVSSPRPPLHDDLDGEHSHPLDSPPPMPPPHMLPHLFPPPNLPPGMPPPFPPPPFLPPHLPPPLLADRRLPPAGRLASPPFHRRMGAESPPEFLERRSPHFDRRSYSPASERSRYSDRQGRYSPDRHGRYSPDRQGRYSPDRQGRYSPNRQGRYSPDRQGRYSPDRQGRFSPDRSRRYSPDRHSDRLYDRHHHNERYNNIDRHSDAYSSNGRNDSQRDSSPDRLYNRSPDGFARKASPPPPHRRLYEEDGGPLNRKGKKTSTPLGPNDR